MGACIKALLLGLFLIGCGKNPNSDPRTFTNVGQGRILVHLINQAPIGNDEIQRITDALNIQLQRDFRPLYDIDAVVQLNTNGEEKKKVFILTDMSGLPEPFKLYLGVHTNGQNAYVNYNLTKDYSTSGTASHEILELLTNPNVEPGGREVCDPVNNNLYTINGIEVSNFVFPNYYIPGSIGPWDYNGLVKHPFTPIPGGENFTLIRS